MIAPFRFLPRLLTALLLTVPGIGLAGTIVLQPESRVEVVNGLPVVTVECVNNGDEPVEVLSAESLLGGNQSTVAIRRSMIPGVTIRQTIPSTRLPSKPGLYQAVTRLRYQSRNGVQFSAVTVAEYLQGTVMPDEWVVPTLAPLTLGRKGTLRVQLLSIDGVAVDTVVRLVLPDEFACDQPERRIRLAPDATAVDSFDISNRRAVPGGVYPVVVVVESMSGGVHRETAVTGILAVTEAQWLGQSRWAWAAAGMLLVAFLLWLGRWRESDRQGRVCIPQDKPAGQLSDAAILTVVTLFVAWQLSPGDWISNTVTVGGDTPAHLYLVSHLKDQLLHHGRIISWAGGWWCGFPMFQFYFALPYAAMALLSLVMPLNVAVKLVSVSGLVALPACAYAAARWMRLPRRVNQSNPSDTSRSEPTCQVIWLIVPLGCKACGLSAPYTRRGKNTNE